MTTDRLEQLLAEIPRLRIAVAGDFFLDRYLVTDPALAELSIETGLEARQVVEVRSSPGAAGTVTNNLAALGVGEILALSVIGHDGEGFELIQGLKATRVGTSRILQSTRVHTPTYMKPMVREPDGERELERLDIKNRSPLAQELEDSLIESLREVVQGERVDAVIIADQVDERNCGCITDRVRAAIGRLADRSPNTLFFADSRARIGEFTGVMIKPNRKEAARALEVEEPDSIEGAGEIGRELARRLGKPAFLTCAEDGILVCTAESADLVSAPPVKGPIDVVGAGDSATAGIVTALCAGATVHEAAEIGNLCAAITIRKLGTTGTASAGEMRERYQAGL